MKKRTLKNLYNPNKQQIKHRNELWAKALEENKKKARNQMESSNGGKCCLQVAQDVASSCGVDTTNINCWYDNALPNINVSKFYGWNGGEYKLEDPTLKFGDKQIPASILNDDVRTKKGTRGLSHKEIAKCVRETYCQ